MLKSGKGREVSKGAVTWPDLPGGRVRVYTFYYLGNVTFLIFVSRLTTTERTL